MLEVVFDRSLQSLSVFYSLKFPYKTKSNLISILLKLFLGTVCGRLYTLG